MPKKKGKRKAGSSTDELSHPIGSANGAQVPEDDNWSIHSHDTQASNELKRIYNYKCVICKRVAKPEDNEIHCYHFYEPKEVRANKEKGMSRVEQQAIFENFKITGFHDKSNMMPMCKRCGCLFQHNMIGILPVNNRLVITINPIVEGLPINFTAENLDAILDNIPGDHKPKKKKTAKKK